MRKGRKKEIQTETWRENFHNAIPRKTFCSKETSTRLRGTQRQIQRDISQFICSFFLILRAFCHLVCAKLVVLFWGLSAPLLHVQAPSCFVSPSLSLVMSLSRHESLGYQCTASDRKRLINKLSCFLSPLYPAFFLKRGLPLLPTTLLLIPAPLPSSSSLLPFSSSLSWMAGSHRCVTIITHTLRKK